MRWSNGFTLLEMIVVIFLLAIISTIAVPNLIDWRNKAKLRSAADNLKGDLELAKMKAVQINGSVAIDYTASKYEIFDDNGATTFKRDSDEQLFLARALPAGVEIDTEESGNIRFKSRGTANAGTLHLIDSTGVKRQVIVSSVGRIRIGKEQD